MPVYNGAQTIRNAIDSLISQTFRDFEVVVFDDGSEDESRAIVREAMSRDPRIRLVGTTRVGLVEALRRGAEASRGEFLARMDADDISHPERLAEQMKLFHANSDLAVVGTHIECFPRERIAGGMEQYERWLNSLSSPEEIRNAMFIESPFCHPTVVMRKSAYQKVGGYLDDGCPEDYGLWLRFDRHGMKMAKVPRVLFSWRESGDRLTRTDSRYNRDKFMELKLSNLVRGPLSTRKSVVIWGAGKEGRRWQKELRLLGIETQCFIDVDPRKIASGVRGISVYGPELLSRQRVPLILAAVGSRGIRDRIRSFLVASGFEERRHFICVI